MDARRDLGTQGGPAPAVDEGVDAGCSGGRGPQCSYRGVLLAILLVLVLVPVAAFFIAGPSSRSLFTVFLPAGGLSLALAVPAERAALYLTSRKGLSRQQT